MLIDTAGLFTNAHRYWRVTFSAVDTYVEVGAMALGRRLEFPRAMPFGFDKRPLRMMSERKTGGFGYRGDKPDHVWHQMRMQFSPSLPRSTCEATGLPSIDDWLRRKWSKGEPWWFSWDGDRTTENFYCYGIGRDRWREPFSSSVRQRPSLSFRARAEGYLAA